ncbi:DHH family phosphoesterase [Yinghuangia soli]|uniref:Bifunctional oligoribonuclease/PAP phosphatase NrnA n=1 Tax=Yinghuangia soli TaxID=2908204 RepID=A0AA41U568_9ACTN|nr:bifunctional oligoribonuclease/PAP phosphatase NrnA [Yinghuangia soli]MCF2533670.1 bifunctional oligoribonuclease/PAP phosphatase NrnA [Yinghuangia soli]
MNPTVSAAGIPGPAKAMDQIGAPAPPSALPAGPPTPPGDGGKQAGPVPPQGAPGLPAPPREEDWDEVVALVGAAPRVYLFAHVNPDGDALGSALAVGLALRELGREAYVSYGDDPLVVPASLTFMPGLDLLVPPAEVPDRPELAMVFDAAGSSRLGLLEAKAKAAAALVVVDHHASNTRFGTHHLIDIAAPATAVLAEELVRRLGGTLTAEVATTLYTGLVTDTGSFKYAATTPETHAMAARLLATGIPHDLISRAIWDTCRFGYLKVLAGALAAAQLDPAAAGGLGMVWTVVTRADRHAYGIRLDEIEGIIDVVRKSAEAEVALVLKEDDNGRLQASSRSKGRVDLGRVCGALGGGGHFYAAGYTAAENDPATVVARFRDLLDDAVTDAPG